MMAPAMKPEPAQKPLIGLEDMLRGSHHVRQPQPLPSLHDAFNPQIWWAGQVHLNAVHGAQTFTSANLGLPPRD